MNLINATKMQAGYSMGMEPSGRELLVVAVKGTFTIPSDGKEARLSQEQVPLIDADQFTGEPGFSAPLYETDYAPKKLKCDVLLNGSAYALKGRLARIVDVELKVGAMSKAFRAVGNRTWKKGMTIRAGEPEPFEKVRISYDYAFGGIDNSHEKPEKHKTYTVNPAGRGFFSNASLEEMEGKPLPNTEELNMEVTTPYGKYKPMAFGSIGRGWEPRYKLAGTYDQDWIDNTFPFLPKDFKEEYYQAAPIDQQIDYLKGGEKVVLKNLTPENLTKFEIPKIEMPVVFFYKDYEEKTAEAIIDTLVIEPDENRFMMTWRTSIPLKKNMFEIVQIVTGKMPKGWYTARRLGKTYYKSLSELVEANNE